MKTGALATAVALLAWASCGADTYTMEWYSMGGDQTASSGGDYSLTKESTQKAGADGWSLEGSFAVSWLVQSPGAPTLELRMEGSQCVISWPVVNGLLWEAQSAPEASGAWTKLTAQTAQAGQRYEVRVAAEAGQRFFRLKAASNQ